MPYVNADLLTQEQKYIRYLQMLSEALTQYVDNSQDCDPPPQYLPDAESFLESVNKQLREMLGA